MVSNVTDAQSGALNDGKSFHSHDHPLERGHLAERDILMPEALRKHIRNHSIPVSRELLAYVGEAEVLDAHRLARHRPRLT